MRVLVLLLVAAAAPPTGSAAHPGCGPPDSVVREAGWNVTIWRTDCLGAFVARENLVCLNGQSVHLDRVYVAVAEYTGCRTGAVVGPLPADTTPKSGAPPLLP